MSLSHWSWWCRSFVAIVFRARRLISADLQTLVFAKQVEDHARNRSDCSLYQVYCRIQVLELQSRACRIALKALGQLIACVADDAPYAERSSRALVGLLLMMVPKDSSLHRRRCFAAVPNYPGVCAYSLRIGPSSAGLCYCDTG